MSLTRKMLKAMGIEEEKIDEIIEAHGETVNGLKAERDEFKEDASKLAEVQKKLNEANAKLEKNGEHETVLKDDYDKLKKEYDDFKSDITAKETQTKKEHAFRELLKLAGVSEKRIDVVMKASAPEINKIEIDEDGKVKDAEAKTEGIKNEWADFIESSEIGGAHIDTPPNNNPSQKDPFEEGFDEG